MDLFVILALPFFIFIARAINVSLGTIRVVFVSKGFKYYAPIIGFFEAIVWLFAIAQVVNDITNMWLVLAYGLGFSAGTYAGIIIEEKLSLGKVRLRLIVRTNYDEVINALQAKEYLLTIVKADYRKDNARIISLLVKRNEVKKVIHAISKINEKIFYSIEDVRKVSEEDEPEEQSTTEKFRKTLKIK